MQETSRAVDLKQASVPALKVGDKYLSFVPTGVDALSVQLFDSQLRLLSANENEAILRFSLPNGEKETLRITVPAKTECSMPGHSSGGDDCCASGSMMRDENCPHERAGEEE